MLMVSYAANASYSLPQKTFNLLKQNIYKIHNNHGFFFLIMSLYVLNVIYLLYYNVVYDIPLNLTFTTNV